MPLPLGGAKGSGMSLAFELLTSVLVGAPIFASFHSDDPAGRKHRQNALLIALDPAAFGDAGAFTEAVDATLSTLKGLPAADDAEGVFYPGERSAAVAAGRAEKGIPVAPNVWRDLAERAGKLGVALPASGARGCVDMRLRRVARPAPRHRQHDPSRQTACVAARTWRAVGAYTRRAFSPSSVS
ncbi:Ldh family oxidoreductase [Streptomyces aurantiogriseus]|nr:Ldh family oxidoreductase [Streptomyces aurantiogriseus]